MNCLKINKNIKLKIAMSFLFLKICLYCALLVAFSSCNRGGSGNKTGRTEEQQRPRRQRLQINIVSPQNNERQPLGATVTLSAKLRDGADAIDSLRWLVNGRLLQTTKGEDVRWNTEGQTTGTHRIEAVAHYASGHRDIVSSRILLLAPQPPKQYTYMKIQEFPHDPKAFTQGLLFHEGYLYESTGIKGESTLRKVNLQTGVPVRTIDLPEDVFGEGLALVDDKLIQLTWQEQVAFEYQISDLKLLRRINYPMREAWGLTFDGTHLLMTDGSATVYFLDREYLAEIRRIEVCDDKGLVDQLNELEYINGELWANIYYKDEIVRIDPKTGAVIGRINLTGLLRNSDRKPDTNVLNGIAYDDETGKIYVTGKNWPKLFEIQVISK